ncbi:MAG: K(+)/H(+) antiporter [Caeruleum heppii]|nr:MAG: K(+)/H(+) antiporter [Caeruleum heppii]
MSSAAATPSSANRVTPQGGVIEGSNPSHFDPKDPIILFIIQAGIIIIFCRLLHWPLSKIRQPRVIAEVIGGILLGPTAIGRIPGFSKAIFPTDSMPVLRMAANLGLILFLFLVGLEVDLRLFFKNWRVALSVGAAGMLLPFGLGCAIAWGLYNEFKNEPNLVPIEFGVFMLFVGVAMSITAFPVLCRILTELKLLGTDVGVVVLSAGVGNDVVGWVLLALCVALVNAGTGLSALYVLLTAIGYILFLIYAVRPAFLWAVRRTGSIQNGPTQSIVALTLLMVLTSSFFTGIIGVHPIFGAFLIGLICPHDGGFAIKLTEKIEDLVSVLLLPLYFALSGLSTNIGLIDSGVTGAYVVGVTAVAFVGKVVGGALAARLCKLVWRESATIGVLMSCKGLVELIVLNIGLQARILSVRTFTIFVVMALVTTFTTTPLTAALYPPWYQKKLEAWKRGEIDWDGNRLSPGDSSSDASSTEKPGSLEVRKLLVYLRLDSLSSLFTFVNLLGGTDAGTATPKVHREKQHVADAQEGDQTEATDRALTKPSKRPVEVYGVRMVELTERTSSVMQTSEIEEYSVRDPIINVFHTLGRMNDVAVSGEVAVAAEDDYAEALTGKASDQSSDLMLIPWSETGSMTEAGYSSVTESPENRFTSGPHNQFIMTALAKATCNTAILVNKGFGGSLREEPKTLERSTTGISFRSSRDMLTAPVADRSHHIFLPFFGGADDRVALRFVLQLAQSKNVTATITFIEVPAAAAETAAQPSTSELDITRSPTTPRRFELPPQSPGQMPTVLKESSGDDVPVGQDVTEQDRTFFNSLADSLPRHLESRVFFSTLNTTSPLRETVAKAKAEVGLSPKNAGDLVVVGRHVGKRPAIRKELITMLTELGHPSGAGAETRRSLGDLAEAMVVGNVKASLLVFQAGGKGRDM